MTIIAWRVPDLKQRLGIDPDQCMTGVKLSLDEQIVEFRVVPNKAIDKLVYTLVEANGCVNTI